MRGLAAYAVARKRRFEAEASLNLGKGTIVAENFVTGGAADFARVCSPKGVVVEIVRRLEGESHAAFHDRARGCVEASGSPRLVVGGIDPAFDPAAVHEAPHAPQRGAITLPEGKGLHPRQAEIVRQALDCRRLAIRAGRRFGKSTALIALCADEALRGRPVGYFTPLFKTAVPVFDDLMLMLAPLVVSKHRAQEIKLSTGSVIRIWSIETAELMGRGHKYALALLDEVAFCKENMGLFWRASISPTLVDLYAPAVVASTPWGTDPANWFFQICNDKSLGWAEIHAKSEDNPYLPREALEEEKRTNSSLVWRQEFEAEFTSLDSAALIDVTRLLQPNGEPWPEPGHLDSLFVVIDSAIKAGAGADGTAALFCGVTGAYTPDKRLWFLDYDIIQVTAGRIEAWFDGVVARARELMGKRTLGAGPVYVEDSATGPILLEKFPQMTEALPNQWMMEGKDVRAYAAQTFFNSGQIRITEACYSKTVSFKGVRINHLWTQMNSFVLGDKEANKRADDLLDCAVYSASLTFRQKPLFKRAA
jgi:hypothetical protein